MSGGPFQARIRELLRAHPDGMTHCQIAKAFGIRDMNQPRIALKGMPDAYIDRWVEAVRYGTAYGTKPGVAGYEAVWCVVTPPENCPHPTGADHEQL